MKIEDDEAPIVEMDYGPGIALKNTKVFIEKEVKGKVVSDKPLARGVATVSDSSLIGQERARIIQWEKSIESLKDKIQLRINQIKLAKKNIKDYEKIEKRKNSPASSVRHGGKINK